MFNSYFYEIDYICILNSIMPICNKNIIFIVVPVAYNLYFTREKL